MRAKNFEEALTKRLDKEEIKTLETQIKLENQGLKILQHDIASALAKHMEETDMGFNELTRCLGVSPSQTAKILKGNANLTCASLAHIAAFLGKRPRLIFN
jgi:hypothetical protein